MTQDRLAGAVRWAFVMSWGREAASAVVTLCLASWLGPPAFGLVSMALTYVLFLRLFVEQGLISALIHGQQERGVRLDSAFWLVLASSLVLGLAGFASAGLWADLNRTPALAPVIRVLSLALPLTGLGVVQQARLQLTLDFRSLALRTNVAVLAGGLAGLVLAWRGAGVWALVAQHVTGAIVELALLWTLSAWRPRFAFSLDEARQLYAYGSRVLVNAIGVFAHRRSDALVLGYFFGPSTVALYRLAERLADMVVELTTRPLAEVALPAFARVRRDPEALARSAREALRGSTLLAWPVLAGLAVAGGVLLPLLGPAWIGAGPVLHVFCALAAVRAMTLIGGPLLQATARPGLMAALTWSLALVSVGGFIVAGRVWGSGDPARQATLMALVRTALFGALYAPVVLLLVARLSGNSVPGLARSLGPAFAAAAATLVSASLVRAGLEAAAAPAWLVLAGIAGCGAIAYLAASSRTRPMLIDGLRRLTGRPMVSDHE